MCYAVLLESQWHPCQDVGLGCNRNLWMLQIWWVGCSTREAAASGLGRLRRLQGKSLHLGNIRQHARSKAHARARASAARDEMVPPPHPRARICRSAEERGRWAAAPRHVIGQESYILRMVRCRSHPRWTPRLPSTCYGDCHHARREKQPPVAPAPGLR